MSSSIYDYHIYTDGSCKSNGSKTVTPRGGWAYLINDGEGRKIKMDSGKKLDTTNNQMELTAVIQALRFLSPMVSKKLPIRVVTDSTHVKNGISSWIKNWKKNGWKTAKKEPVKNKDLWKELDSLTESFYIKWDWVGSHSKVLDTEDKKFNDLVDKMAQKEADLL